VEVAVGLGGKAGLDDRVAELLRAHVLGDDVAEEAGGASVETLSFVAFRIRVGHGFHSLFHGRAVLNKSGANLSKPKDSLSNCRFLFVVLAHFCPHRLNFEDASSCTLFDSSKVAFDTPLCRG